jgi:hypothetical protein
VLFVMPLHGVMRIARFIGDVFVACTPQLHAEPAAQRLQEMARNGELGAMSDAPADAKWADEKPLVTKPSAGKAPGAKSASGG